MTRAVTIFLSGEDQSKLTDYAELIADLVDEAMIAQENAKEVPAGVTYDGVQVVDPDEPDETETIEPEVIQPEKE